MVYVRAARRSLIEIVLRLYCFKSHEAFATIFHICSHSSLYCVCIVVESAHAHATKSSLSFVVRDA